MRNDKYAVIPSAAKELLCSAQDDTVRQTFPDWGRGTTPGVPRRELVSVGGSRDVVDEANTIQRRAMMPKELLRSAQADSALIILHP